MSAFWGKERIVAHFAAAATNGFFLCYVWQAFIRGAFGGGFRLCVQNGGEARPQYARRAELRWKFRSTDAPQGADWKADGPPTIFAAFQTNRRRALELDKRRFRSIRSCSVRPTTHKAPNERRERQAVGTREFPAARQAPDASIAKQDE